MGKKMDDAEVKKECPSCGLGVSLDAKICEFCGWDFDEEDEWILQIEKLERDLVLEKQKFEPGTVGSKIESSLHTPAAVRKEQLKASAARAKLQQQMEEVLGTSGEEIESEEPTPAPRPEPVVREVRHEEVKLARPIQQVRPREVPPAGPVAKKEPELAAPPKPASAPSGKVRRIRKVKGAPPSQAPQAQPEKGKVVRKAKQ